MSEYGNIEYCDNCHYAKRIQFTLHTKGDRALFRYCCAACMKEHVANVMFAENPDWLKFQWIAKELDSQDCEKEGKKT